MRQGSEDGDGGLLSLAEALSVSGMTKLLLHAWERRYGIEPAQRSETGRRFYTVEQAERLRLLKVCSDAGHRIGNLVTLTQDDLRRIEASEIARQRNAPLIQALQTLNVDDFRTMLRDRAVAEGPGSFLDATALPLMRDIEARWADGALSMAAEHLATVKIKRVLGTMIDQCPRLPETAPRLIIATPSGEEHEIGALAATLVARLHGTNSLFLGPNLPPEEIAATALAWQARCVCMSASAGKPARLQAGIRALRLALPAEILLVTGGPAYAALPVIDGVRHLPHLDAFRSLVNDAL